MAWGQGGRKRARGTASLELRVRPQDRIGGHSGGRSSRQRRDDGPRPSPKRSGGKRGRSGMGRLIYWGAVFALWLMIAGIGAVVWIGIHLPPIQSLEIPKRPPSTLILGLNGATLATRGDMGGAAVPMRELPVYVPNAFVAIEDRRFYSHHGVDPWGILRAAIRDVLHRGAAQGGSTITQQLAKNLFLTQERTITRKLQEVVLAFWLEHKYSKPQILELYLNRVYFGAGAYGVEAAAQRYFGKSARQLTIPEAAMLAGLVQSPSRLAPTRNPDGAERRAQLVIDAMVEQRMISPEAGKLALLHPARAKQPTGGGSVNYVADWVMDAVNDLVGHIDQDVVVDTSIDPALQNSAEQALIEGLAQRGEKLGVSEGALVAMTPDGTVRALVGGRSYEESQFDRAISAKRQPGSAFKPFVYLTALEHGLTPDTVREDAPIAVRSWKPENFEHEYFGPVTLTQALANSLNTVSVRLTLEVGPAAVIRTAYRMGINSQLEPNASIALGTSEVSLFELVVRLCTICQWRVRSIAACGRARAHHRGQDTLQAPAAAARPHRRFALRRNDERHDARDPGQRHGAPRRPSRVAGGRQDRHQPGFPRRLVHRLHLAPRHWRVARQRRFHSHPQGDRRWFAGRHLEPFYEGGAARHRAVAAARPVRRRMDRSRRRCQTRKLHAKSPRRRTMAEAASNSWLLDKLFGQH